MTRTPQSRYNFGMPGRFRKSLGAHLNKKHSTHAGYRLLANARKRIHQAIREANAELEQFGYYAAVVTDRGSMISVKVYRPSLDRDFAKNRAELVREAGYPINLQLSFRDLDGLTIYSFREGGQGQVVVTSKKDLEIEKAIYAELEREIKTGIDFAK